MAGSILEPSVQAAGTADTASQPAVQVGDTAGGQDNGEEDVEEDVEEDTGGAMEWQGEGSAEKKEGAIDGAPLPENISVDEAAKAIIDSKEAVIETKELVLTNGGEGGSSITVSLLGQSFLHARNVTIS